MLSRANEHHIHVAMVAAAAAAAAARLLVVVVAVGLVAGARGQTCAPVPDPAIPGNVYDISGLVNPAADYTGTFSTVATYGFQFCRTVVAPIDAIACSPLSTMVCEKYAGVGASVGIAPTTLSVVSAGNLQLTYTKGTCRSHAPAPAHIHG
jgi:hypothetical protein